VNKIEIVKCKYFGAGGNYRSTALILVCRIGRIAVARALLARGADLNIADSEGYTVLHYAVSDGNLDICHLLVEAGADLNKIDY
jgi:uncharacterized protein